ncbi:hypothetical protein GGR52DRAFT_577189 [Hypoxylon sp. FL1284]|nr:hypothetical protein GGR52DRAFT_577189 [Hypoxylon sp. FL1284]
MSGNNPKIQLALAICAIVGVIGTWLGVIVFLFTCKEDRRRRRRVDFDGLSELEQGNRQPAIRVLAANVARRQCGPRDPGQGVRKNAATPARHYGTGGAGYYRKKRRLHDHKKIPSHKRRTVEVGRAKLDNGLRPLRLTRYRTKP